MHLDESTPPSIVRRAADIARGPHACPSCECPTFTEPPVPWTGLRDYVVRCTSCERPIAVRLDRDRLQRGRANGRGRTPATTASEAIDELLDSRGRRAFNRRLRLASVVPALGLVLALFAGASPVLALSIAVLVIVPSALWAPALWITAASMSRNAAAAMGARLPVIAGRRSQRTEVVEVARARWDQWQREERQRERDRLAHPDAVLRELERVLDDRELRRVRAQAARGEVPAEHLEDLLRYRKAWSSVA